MRLDIGDVVMPTQHPNTVWEVLDEVGKGAWAEIGRGDQRQWFYRHEYQNWAVK